MPSFNQRQYYWRSIVFGLVLALNATAWAVPFESKKFAMAAVSQYGVDAAKKTILAGGNIVDATVAATLAMGVTTPFFASMGGGGFALIHFKGETYVLDFREVAPGATGPDYYLKKIPSAPADGGTAVAVPGVVAGLWQMHQKFGSKKWASLFEPALNLADKGFVVSGEWHRYTSRAFSRLSVGHEALLDKGQVPEPSFLLKQPKLKEALKIIQKNGHKGFYEGPVAQDLVESVKSAGGELTLEDLKKYKAEWRTPIKFQYQNHEIAVMPPPSSTAVVMGTALKLFEHTKASEQKPGSAQELHLIAESFKRAFRGRFLLGDPKFANNPIRQLTSPEYVLKQFKDINLKKATPVDMASDSEIAESNETTHFSLMDEEGNAVALTITLNGNYGSGVVTKKFGIALNNEMDDFTTRPGEPNQFGLVQGEANRVEAGKRPLSSMSPTIVFKEGKPVLALGAQGGPRIISSVTQVIYRVLANNFDLDQAIQFGRVHHQVLPDKTYVDPLRSNDDTHKKLREMGHQVEEETVARVYGVRRNAKGWLEAAHDSRGEGASGGL